MRVIARQLASRCYKEAIVRTTDSPAKPTSENVKLKVLHLLYIRRFRTKPNSQQFGNGRGGRGNAEPLVCPHASRAKATLYTLPPKSGANCECGLVGDNRRLLQPAPLEKPAVSAGNSRHKINVLSEDSENYCCIGRISLCKRAILPAGCRGEVSPA